MDKSMYEYIRRFYTRGNLHEILELFEGIPKNHDLMTLVIAMATLALIKRNEGNPNDNLKLDILALDETTRYYLEIVERKHSDKIEKIANRVTSNSLRNIILFTDPSVFSDEHFNTTPDGIVKLALALLNVQSEDIILDLGSGELNFLIQAAYESNSNSLYGVEINSNNIIISNLRASITRLPIKLIQGNMLSQDYSNIKANKVFSNFPLGISTLSLSKMVEDNSQLARMIKENGSHASSDWMFGAATHLNTSSDGRTVIVMSNVGTWNKADVLLRRKLIEDGHVEGVILLPTKLYASTKMSFCLIVLSQNNKEVRMVDASKLYVNDGKLNLLDEASIEKILNLYNAGSDNEMNVSTDTLALNEYVLYPLRYLGYEFKMDNSITLGEVCKSIRKGIKINKSTIDELHVNNKTNVHYLKSKDIVNGRIVSSQLSLAFFDNSYQSHCVSYNDLLVSNYYPFNVTRAKVAKGEKIIASDEVFVVSLDVSKVNPLFIQFLMQSDIVQLQLNKMAIGSLIQRIKIQNIKDIKIPNLSRNQQDMIASEFEEIENDLDYLEHKRELLTARKLNLIEKVLV